MSMQTCRATIEIDWLLTFRWKRHGTQMFRLTTNVSNSRQNPIEYNIQIVLDVTLNFIAYIIYLLCALL
jgi:hypothetical protein